MNYSQEELLPLVVRMAEKYTSKESSSITYEKAEQLMGAVIYCINEYEASISSSNYLQAKPVNAEAAYEKGKKLVYHKTGEALKLYNELVYRLRGDEPPALRTVFSSELPQFFQYYDIEYAPQEDVSWFSYQVSKDLSGLSGADKVYEYLNAIREEMERTNRIEG